MQCYDEKCDLWSVGMLAYQMLTGRFPFWEDVRRESLTDVWKAILTQEINWDAPVSGRGGTGGGTGMGGEGGRGAQGWVEKEGLEAEGLEGWHGIGVRRTCRPEPAHFHSF